MFCKNFNTVSFSTSNIVMRPAFCPTQIPNEVAEVLWAVTEVWNSCLLEEWQEGRRMFVLCRGTHKLEVV